MLKAYKGNTCIATSKKIYVITSNYSGKYSNATKIKASFTKASIRVSDSKTLSAKLTQYKNKKQKNAWGATTFVSSNTDIAKVTSKGKITAVKKGTVKIYTIAPNGLYATTTVTVLDKIYSIAFDSNGGIGDAIEPISMKYNSSKKLPANTFTFAGQTFAGWALTSNATEPTYKDEASVKNLTDVNGATVTLYAVWTPNQYALDFKAYPAGLSTNIRNATVTYGKAYGALPEVSEREGYTFIGWYTDPENGEKITAETVFIGSEAVTLYARWEKDPED